MRLVYALTALALGHVGLAQEVRFLEVPADHAKPDGPKLKLRATILKATGSAPKPDPLVYLAGGPGGAASDSLEGLDRAFAALRRERDIVMLDQRGTGGSARYDCTLSAGAGQQQPLASATFPLGLIAVCAEGPSPFTGVPRGTTGDLFTTAQSADDLAVAAAALGYRELNLYGVSYGTRLGLVFLKRHPEMVRSMALQGTVLPGAPIPVTGTLATDRALARLITDCESDPACSRAYPEFGAQVRGLLAEAGAGQTLWSTIVSAALYGPELSARLPFAVKRAVEGNRSELFALSRGGGTEGEGGGLSPGVYLSIICGEDVPRITEEELAQLRQTMSGDATARGLMRTCRPWPKATVGAALPAAAKPVLLIAGELDPITPLDQAELAAKALPKSKLVVLRATGHSGAAHACAASMIASFVQSGEVDAACAEAGRRPTFYIP